MALILLIVGFLVVLFFLPIIELVLVPIFIGAAIGTKTSAEVGWWAFLASLIIGFAVYYSRAGVIFSVIFSGFWALIAGAIVFEEIKWSMISGILIGLIVFAISYRIHEQRRTGGKKAETGEVKQ